MDQFGIVVSRTGQRGRLGYSALGKPISVLEDVGMEEYQGPISQGADSVTVLTKVRGKFRPVTIKRRDIVSMVVLN